MNGKIFQAHSMEELILLKYPYYSNQSINLAQYLSKILTSFFTEIEEKYHKICMELQKTLNSQSNFEKKKSWRHHTSRFQNILQSYSNKRSKVLALKTDQLSRTETPEKRSHTYMVS